MADLKRLNEKEFNDVISTLPYRKEIMIKDYYITVILYLLKDLAGICFKGGTALQKMFLNYSRMSEDIDFTVTGDLEVVRKAVVNHIKSCEIYARISVDKDVDGFTRLVIAYKGFDGREGPVLIDLNKRAKVILRPVSYQVRHFYQGFIPEFAMKSLSRDEMVAEKVAAAIGRNRPRDHYDLYRIAKQGIPIDMGLARRKCIESGVEFDIIKMFNNARKLKNRWDTDLQPLITEQVSFQEVMRFLSGYFKLSMEKAKRILPSNLP
ncbi:MAG: nucleotidyl transferase AbiEii/AbiGii toxin family protein [Candidatus Woesearchaeota archaeon]